MNNHVLSFPFVLLSLITAGFYQLSLLGAVGYGDALLPRSFSFYCPESEQASTSERQNLLEAVG